MHSTVLPQELHPIRVNEVRTQPFSSAHPTRPTGCTAVLHFHPHMCISCPPRTRTVRATRERKSERASKQANERTSERGSAAARARALARVRISRGMTVPGHMAGEMKSESTKAGTKKSLRNSRERSPRAVDVRPRISGFRQGYEKNGIAERRSRFRNRGIRVVTGKVPVRLVHQWYSEHSGSIFYLYHAIVPLCRSHFCTETTARYYLPTAIIGHSTD